MRMGDGSGEWIKTGSVLTAHASATCISYHIAMDADIHTACIHTPSGIQSVAIACSVVVSVKFMVAVVTVAVVVVLLAKVLVWDEAVVNMLVEEFVDITIVDVGVALGFGVTVSHSVDVDVVVDVRVGQRVG